MKLINLPLFYLYQTRILNYRGLIGYISLEIGPLILIIYLINGLSGIILFPLFYLGWLSIYEIGYYSNDKTTTSLEAGGDRLADHIVSKNAFLTSHFACFLIINLILSFTFSFKIVTTYFLANCFVLVIFLLHNYLPIYFFEKSRIFTFPLLIFFKPFPILLPFLGLGITLTILIWIFLFIGLARTTIYYFRKYGKKRIGLWMQKNELFLAVGILSFMLLFYNRVAIEPYIKSLWLYYFFALLILIAFKLIRSNLSKFVIK